MAGNKKIYSLDEYYKDRYGGQMAVSPLNRTVRQNSGSVFSRPPAPAGAMQKRQQILSSMNPIEKPQQPTAPTQPAPTQQATGAATTVQKPEQASPLTEKEFNSKLTTANTMSMLEDALASLAEWGNRKFVYNAKESPLYTILQQQAEKEARLASGRAYSRAVANTGGFGSSYATLAAEEAGRQVMEGLDDQQLALYQAAREEFEAERQSRVDWYNTAKQLHNDRMALDELQAIEAAAKASGMNTDTYNLLQTAVAEGWYDGTNKATVRNKLETMALGNPNINVDAIMTQLEGGQKAQMTDLVSGLSINPTLSGAAEIMAQAKVNGTEAEVLPQVSTSVSKGFTGALANPSTAYGLLDVEPEEWNAMFAEYTDPDERAAAQKAYVLDAAGEARKSGMLSGDDYMAMLTDDVNKELNAISQSKYDIPQRDIANIVIGMQNYRDAGYISEEEYTAMLDNINSKRSASDVILMAGQSKKRRTAGKLLKAIVGEDLFGINVDELGRESDLIAYGKAFDRAEYEKEAEKRGITEHYYLTPVIYSTLYNVMGDSLGAWGLDLSQDQMDAYMDLLDRESDIELEKISKKTGKTTKTIKERILGIIKKEVNKDTKGAGSS